MSATQQPRPNPMKGRVVARGETTASAGNVANIITVVRILLAPVFVWMRMLGDRRPSSPASFLVAATPDTQSDLFSTR